MKFSKVKKDELRYTTLNFKDNDIVLVELNDNIDAYEADRLAQVFKNSAEERGLKNVTFLYSNGSFEVHVMSEASKRELLQKLKQELEG